MSLADKPTRRHLLKGGAGLLGGLAIPYVATGSVDARGAVLPDLAECALRRDGSAVFASLEAGPCPVEVAGREVDLLCYNGTFPGPLLRLRQDDELHLAFKNRLDAPTNVHTHGMAVSPEGNGDNPFLRIGPGGRQQYRLDLRGDPRNAGLFWYHPHFHGTDARQLAAGLAGPIVVEGEADPGALLGPHDERVLVLKDLRLADQALDLHRPGDWLMGWEGEQLLVNGLEEPVIEARERRVRLRMINASNARYWDLALPGAEALHLVALDGHVTEAPLPTTHVALAPGQRADLVVDLPRNGPVEVIDRPVPRVAGKGRRPRRVMQIAPPARLRAAPDPLPARLVDPAPDPAPGPAPERAPAAVREVVLSLFYICGGSYGGPDAAPLYRPRLGSRETWRLWNADTMDHPFHLHTWPFRVETLDGRPVDGRPLRDTLNLRPGGRAEVSVDFTGVSGLSMFHCHIAEHAAKGMMATLEVAA